MFFVFFQVFFFLSVISVPHNNYTLPFFLDSIVLETFSIMFLVSVYLLILLFKTFFLSHTQTHTRSIFPLSLSLTQLCGLLYIFIYFCISFYHTLFHFVGTYKYPTLEIIPLTERKTEKEKEMCAP